MSGEKGSQPHRAYLIKSHTVLNEQPNTGVEETDIALEDKVTLGLGRDPRLEFSQPFLGCGAEMKAEWVWGRRVRRKYGKDVPRPSSSSTSTSCSAAMLKSAVTE